MFFWLRKCLLAFLLGVLTFTPWEILMVRAEIVSFSRPEFLGIPRWMPIVFGAGTVALVVLFYLLERLFHFQASYQGGKLVLEYLMIAVVYTAVLFFKVSPYLLSLGLFTLLVLRLILFHRPWDLTVFLIGACFGPTLELFLTNLHLYSFTEPDFLGMPYWLPLLWGTVSLAMRRLTWVLIPTPAEPGRPGPWEDKP